MNLGIIFKELLSVTENDAETVLLPLIGNAATSLAANPSAVNAVSVGSQLLIDSIGKAPIVGQEVLQSIAAEVNAAVLSAIAKIPKPTTPTAPAA